jgi:hypothetical protein
VADARIVGRRLHFELAYGGLRRREGHAPVAAAAVCGHVGDAVDLELVIVLARAVGSYLGRGLRGHGLPKSEVGSVDDARGQKRQFEGIRAALREFGDPALVDNLAEGGARGLEYGRLGRHLDGLGHGTNFHLDVEVDRFADADLDLVADERLETLEFGVDLVGADGKIGQAVNAALVGLGRGGDACLGVRGSDFDVRDDGARRVGDGPGDIAARILRPGDE